MTIKEKDYKLKYTLRALFVFEQITKKPFKLETVTDQYIFFYSMLVTNNPDMDLTFDDMIEAVDEDPVIMVEFQKFLEKEMEKRNIFPSNEDAKKKF